MNVHGALSKIDEPKISDGNGHDSASDRGTWLNPNSNKVSFERRFWVSGADVANIQ